MEHGIVGLKPAKKKPSLVRPKRKKSSKPKDVDDIKAQFDTQWEEALYAVGTCVVDSVLALPWKSWANTACPAHRRVRRVSTSLAGLLFIVLAYETMNLGRNFGTYLVKSAAVDSKEVPQGQRLDANPAQMNELEVAEVPQVTLQLYCYLLHFGAFQPRRPKTRA